MDCRDKTMDGWNSAAFERDEEDRVDRYVLFLITALRAPSLLALSNERTSGPRIAGLFISRLRTLLELIELETESAAFTNVARAVYSLAVATASHAIVSGLGDLLREAARECPQLEFNDFVAALFGEPPLDGGSWCAPLQRAVDLTAGERSAMETAFVASREIVDARDFGGIWIGAMVHYATANNGNQPRRAVLDAPQFDVPLAPFYITEHAAKLIAVLEKNVQLAEALRNVEPFHSRARLLPALANAYGDQLATYIMLPQEPQDRQLLLELYGAEVNRLVDKAAELYDRARVNRVDFLVGQLRAAIIGELTGQVPEDLQRWFVSGDHRLIYYAGQNYLPRPAVYIEEEQPAINAMGRIYERMRGEGPFSQSEVKLIVTMLELALLYVIVENRSRARLDVGDLLRGEASLRLQLTDAVQESFDSN